MRHLTDEISARSSTRATFGGSPSSSNTNSGGLIPKSPESGRRVDVGGGAGADTAATDKLESRVRDLELENTALRDRIQELEATNLQLEDAAKLQKDKEEAEDPRAAELLASMQQSVVGDSVLRDQLEDLQFQLKATQKRLKAASETIKKQAQRIELLEASQ